MSKKGTYRQTRINLTRLFVGAMIVALLVSRNGWEVASPVTDAMLFLSGCFLVGIAALGRLWCSLYVAGHKTKDLVTVGPYSICRNPLYFFSMVGGVAVGLISETITLPLVVLVVFAFYYPYVIRYEENKLRAMHGDKFEAYFRTVPRFWPKWSLLTEPEEYVVSPRRFRKHIFSALWFIWIIGILETIECFHEMKLLPDWFPLY